MRFSLQFLVAAVAVALGSFVTLAGSLPSVQAQEIDEEVPPGNPVIGSDRPGDTESQNDTRYGLWAVVAVCLIGAGVLLVKLERWEARRMPEE